MTVFESFCKDVVLRSEARGTCSAHHGELLQGAFGDEGRPVHALVTLPCRLAGSEARVVVQPGPGGLVVKPPWRAKAARAAALTLRTLGVADKARVEVSVSSDIPAARGFGSSTADVTATIRALASAFEVTLSGSEIARLAVASELAADPVMIKDVVLFAHREGRAIEELGASLPSLTVVGFYSGDPDGAGIDTLSLSRPRYSADELGEFERLRVEIAAATADSSARAVGQVATRSAWINQSYLPVRGLARLCEISEECGGVGVQIAHSGDVAGMLFDGDRGEDQLAEAQAKLRECGITNTWQFATGGVPAPRKVPPARGGQPSSDQM